ncbi:phosphatase [Weizmannia acidilactici]|uniref:Phosphatase n=1 Tax=Weizmannia acidilactici TaxID=2607726 RepID=A0A5J4JE85_9BACI|nr:HAD family hydrolase [Weizmannia acidilactici]GER66583.1 phosphatase [Weizmannia acidilactici]GER68857.1 phosphatase [Weizmannia acidilactici]GER73482.1 phosphatase [Weizmannia acidilactici]
MAQYQALFLDIDGTILTPDDTVQPSTKQAVAEVQKQGVEVFLATGRPIHEISWLADELNIQSMIGYNGALAVHRGKNLFKTVMDSSMVDEFIEIAAKHSHEAILYTDRQNFITSFDSPVLDSFLKKLHLRQNVLYTPEVHDQILGITFVNIHGDEASLYETYPGLHLSQVNLEGFGHCYDVILDTVNKGIAVTNALGLLGIPKENAIAFGDGMNDKEMLLAAGESFAMGNSDPELFPYAKRRTASVTDSGIYNGLKTLGLVK